MKQKTKNISVLIIAATIALAAFTASTAADTTVEHVNISVTSPNTYFPAPEPITVPENITELRVSADMTDVQIDIHLYDPSGRHTGATYPTGEETNIPNSTYSGWNTDPEKIRIMNPIAGNYTLKAYGYFATGWANCTIKKRVLTTIKVMPPTAEAYIGRTEQFTATAYDQYNEPMAGINITWTSSNTTVGTVSPWYGITDENGNVTTTFTALAEGTTTIKAENVRTEVNGTTSVNVVAARLSYITGQVKGQNRDGTFPLLTDGVTITVIWSQNGTKYADFEDATSPDGNFSIPLPPYTQFDIKWNKVGYEEDSEERVTILGPGETKDLGVRYLTQLAKVLVVEVTPTEVKGCIDSPVTAMVTDKDTGDLVDNATVTFKGCGVDESGTTNAAGQVTFTIHPTSAPCTITVTATKAGYQSGEATIEIVEKELVVVVNPGEVTKGINTSVTATVTDKDTGDPVDNATVTFKGCGVDESGTTNAAGQVTVTIHPTSVGTITVTATKSCYRDNTTTISVTEIPYGYIVVDVVNRANGKNIGKNHPWANDTANSPKGPWPVHEVYVTAWDSATNELLGIPVKTVNGTATLSIPIPGGGSRVVDVNSTEVPATSNQTTSIPGITKGSEKGITVLENKSVPAIIEVTIINPPPPKPKHPKYLEIKEVEPSIVRLCEDKVVTVTVVNRSNHSEPIESATVNLLGCGVSESGTTNADGEVSFTIHPRASTAPCIINVTATKTDYIGDNATITVIDREILVVHVIDADNSSRIPEGATVELYNTTNVLVHWDTADATGTVTFNASHIDCIGDWYWILAYKGGYRDYEEHGIWLPATEIKTKTTPLIPTI